MFLTNRAGQLILASMSGVRSPARFTPKGRGGLAEIPASAFTAMARIQARSEFAPHRAMLSDFLGASLRFKAQPKRLLEAQAEAALGLMEIERSKRELEAQLSAATDPELADEITVALVASKLLTKTIRSIGDGIAWRTLGYDRPVIQQLTAKSQTGHLSRSFPDELISAARVVEELDSPVVMSDLTNCVRYGDFVFLHADGVTIEEVKSGSGVSKSGRAVRQSKARQDMEDFVRSRERVSFLGHERLLLLDGVPVYHLGTLQELIVAARETGSAFTRLSDSLAVEVFLVEAIIDRFPGGPSERMFLQDPFRGSSRAGQHHSIKLALDDFTPNVVPYSVFPLDPRDRVDVMTGALWVTTYFSERRFVRALRRRGLFVDWPTEGQLRKLTGLKRGEVREASKDIGILVSRFRDFPEISLPIADLNRICLEFLDEESFADGLVALLEARRPDDAYVGHWSFRHEANIWE